MLLSNTKDAKHRILISFDSCASDRSPAVRIVHGRYGYRRITALLRAEGWRVNHKRVERLWRLTEAKTLIENWRVHYNEVRPHSSLNYQPPAPKVIIPQAQILDSRYDALHEPVNSVH